MSLQKTEAIVLKSIKYGETSKILTLYSRKFGKIKVIAKGARGMKSRYGGTLEPANHIAIVFYEKENRDLQFLSQADIIETFAKKKQTLEKSSLAMAACELVDRLEIGMTPNPRLFKYLLETLRNLHAATGHPMNCFRAFQIHIFEIVGVKPNLKTCIHCKQPCDGEASFDIPRGGFYCERCTQMRHSGMFLPKSVMDILRQLQLSPIVSLNGQLELPADQQLVDNFLLAYFRYHVEGFRELNSLKFLRQVSRPSAHDFTEKPPER